MQKTRMGQLAVLALALALTLAGCSSCKTSPYRGLARGYRATNYSARFAEQFDAALAKYLESQRTLCKSKHKTQTPEYDQCILPALRISRAWTGRKAGKETGKGVLPTLQSAQRATRIALDAAYDYVKSHEAECKKEHAQKKCTGDWMALLKPSLCALSELVDRAIKIGAFKTHGNETYKTIMTIVQGFACRK